MRMCSDIRGRFAPTPSGYLHIGNAMTALLAWLHIRSLDGQFILRIEDIDARRSRSSYMLASLDDLRWLGLDWDEGPDVGGAFGPYVQTDRMRLYQSALEKLKEAGYLYPCFCSRKDRQALASAPHRLSSSGPVYDGRCRHLTEAERRWRTRSKIPAWRFALSTHEVEYDDLALGPQTFPPGFGGDFVVYRADEVFGYQLAVVVDDAAMHITHVLRGADLLDSTPRQIQLYNALSLTSPQFAHVPLVYSPSGQRLSKRDKGIALRELRTAGVKPQAVVGLLACYAGLIDKPEALNPQDLVPLFDLQKIPRESIALDVEHLRAI